MSSFTLSEDDPNYEAYAGLEEEGNTQIYYYKRASEDIKNNESRTMYVDFTHMSSFQWQDPQFMDLLQSEYIRFEPYLRQGLTQFLADEGH